MTFQICKTARMRKIVLSLLTIAVIITQCGCSGNEAQPVSSYGEDYLLNTYCAITIYEEGREELIKDAFSYARSLENLLSRTVSGSEVYAFNHSGGGQPFPVSDITGDVVQRGLQYGEISKGLFDITVGTLTELWNFSAAEPVVPSPEAVSEALIPVGYQTVEVIKDADGEYFLLKDNSDTRIDLGGIAKGYIADRVYEFLDEKGVESAIINFGGNILTLGQKEDGTPWNIGVEKPFSESVEDGLTQRELVGMLSFSGGSVVTSGTYERKFYEDGTLYYHILDPATGYPRQTDLVSVTIIGPSSMECDALSTTCLMLGAEEGKLLIDSLPEYEAVFIDASGEIVLTDGAGFTAY